MENVSPKEFLKERLTLNDKVKYLETTIYKCVNGNDKLDAIPEKQKCSLDKVGIGFNPFKRRTFSKTKPTLQMKRNKFLAFIIII